MSKPIDSEKGGRENYTSQIASFIIVQKLCTWVESCAV